MKVMFPSLIGRLTTEFDYTSICIYYFVSIPHRQANNVVFVHGQLNRVQVSIPHRQANNVIRSHSLTTFFFVSIPHRQANNDTPRIIYKTPTKFPSLIGRLTTCLRRERMRGGEVSIPHRQANNPCMWQVVGVGYGFHPHRQANNYFPHHILTPYYCVSIPHRQANNCLRRERMRGRRSFHPSQVG